MISNAGFAQYNHKKACRSPSVGSTRAVAVSIADDLFVNGDGDEAIRLVLDIRMKKDGGGWCKEAVIDLIERKLNALNQR